MTDKNPENKKGEEWSESGNTEFKVVLGDYGTVPEDINYYMKNSVMARYPEVTLFDFLRDRPDKEWIKFCEETGANLTDEHDASQYYQGNFKQISDNKDKWIQYMMDNEATCQKKFTEKRPYHAGVNELTLNLPMKCGYNWANNCEYNWGLYGDTSNEIKQLVGQEMFDELGMDMETCLPRLMAYLPGQTLPWHFDFMGNWYRLNEHLNPNAETRRCDGGKIVRYLVFITDWHWGHMLQMANTFYPKWKSGDVYELPEHVYHLSTNAGMSVKVSLSLTGYLPGT